MSKTELRFRQIHMDFHTSEVIEQIAADFDPDEFADTLRAARVDSVTCFARCHHGWLYYPSQKFPELIHPHLQRRNLLGEQIEACHARNIRVPIYITVQWDHRTAMAHPEWLCVDEHGAYEVYGGEKADMFEPGFYRFLCVNTPYRDFLKTQTQEVCETLPVDGIFFDIVQPRPCACPKCVADMLERGMDPTDRKQRVAFGHELIHEFKRDMSAFVRRFHPEATIFHNAGHIGPETKPSVDAYSHFELESLPSGGWGYLHFPLTIRYARHLGDCMGMTGKFHTSWGDFQSFKNPAALEFECFQMLALGAKCSIGDQLHPSGAICKDTYELIGSVYSRVEAKEPWCRGARPLSEVAVLTPEAYAMPEGTRATPAMLGATRILQELRVQFDRIDENMDFTRYRLLILPDTVPGCDHLDGKLRAFLDQSGALLTTGRSGLGEDGATLSCLPAQIRGDAPYSPDFLRPGEALGKGLRPTAYVMYQRGVELEPADGAEILAEVEVPYFNRTWQHFCSHRHTPPSGKTQYPGAVGKGNVICLAHPVFGQYDDCAPLWCKKLVANALGLLLPDPLLCVSGPSSLTASVNAQPDENRLIVHLLHYIPERRGQRFDVIEDVIPIRDVKVSLRTDAEPAAVRCRPEGRDLPFEWIDGRTEFTLDTLEGHRMIEVALG